MFTDVEHQIRVKWWFGGRRGLGSPFFSDVHKTMWYDLCVPHVFPKAKHIVIFFNIPDGLLPDIALVTE